MADSYLYFIVVLLPIAALMVVLQDDPYHALVVRGVLGAIAAMMYAVMGAADVALTEALVGTMLAITLYAIAVRSSLVMRLGVLEEAEPQLALEPMLEQIRGVLKQHHMRLELVPHVNVQALQRALLDRDVHAVCTARSLLNSDDLTDPCPYHMAIRVRRLYEILQAELAPGVTSMSHINIADANPLRLNAANDPTPGLEEARP